MSDEFGGQALSCPMPNLTSDVVRLGHGSGGKMTANLIESVFLPLLGNDILAQLDDAAIVSISGARLAMTTDAYVVNPIFFPGGDIGSLAVHGTVNDLAMRGAQPLFLSASFILEEGMSIQELSKIARSLGEACTKCGVKLIAADTKVVNRGCADRLFITTCGIGLVKQESAPAANQACPGDRVLVSGDIGRHGMAIMCAREGIEFETLIESDSAPMHELVQRMLSVSNSVHCLRDITRGGLSSTLNELATSSCVGIELEESQIPIHPEVRAACELLGLDPFHVACEGRLVAVVSPEDADTLLSAMKAGPEGEASVAIGKVVEEHPGRVVMRSRVGGKRIVDKLSGEQLPRIC